MMCATHKAKREKLGHSDNNAKGNGNGNDGHRSRQDRSESYKPNFTYPSYPFSSNTINHIINVTRLINVNSTEISHSNNNDWLVDSAANAYCTPYKSDLRSYVETEVGKVKGFGGTLTTAVGKGSMTLIDPRGYRLTLHDVCYCPQSQDRIISLMKFRREHHVDFQFTGLETFMLHAANGFKVHGHSINDILHVSFKNQPQVNSVTTRNAAKFKRQDPHDEHGAEEALSHLTEDGNSDLQSQMDIDCVEPRTNTTPLICSPQELWHLRLGHASTTTLRKMQHLIRSSFDSRKCTSSLRAKKTRKPFPRSESKADVKLECVHSDICGPFPASRMAHNTTSFSSTKPRVSHIHSMSKTDLQLLSRKSSSNTWQKLKGNLV